MAAHHPAKIDSNNVLESVLDLVSSQTDIARGNIGPDSLLVGDLGMDSFSAVELMFELEKISGLEISDQDVQTFKKVSDIVAYIQQRLPTGQK